jgi:hypothetical protein
LFSGKGTSSVRFGGNGGAFLLIAFARRRWFCKIWGDKRDAYSLILKNMRTNLRVCFVIRHAGNTIFPDIKKKIVELFSYLDLVLKISANSGARLGQFLSAKTKIDCSDSSCPAEERTFDHFQPHLMFSSSRLMSFSIGFLEIRPHDFSGCNTQHHRGIAPAPTQPPQLPPE